MKTDQRMQNRGTFGDRGVGQAILCVKSGNLVMPYLFRGAISLPIRSTLHAESVATACYSLLAPAL